MGNPKEENIVRTNNTVRMMDEMRNFGFSLTEKQAEEICLAIGDEASSVGFDTAANEKAVDALSQKLMGCDWPSNGDSRKYQSEFFKWLATVARIAGYVFNHKMFEEYRSRAA